MRQKKWNISRWSALGLSVLLLTACMLLASGTAWARYRAEIDKLLSFRTREPVAVHMGHRDPETLEFTASDTLEWVTEDGQQMLQFTVANGPDKEKFEEMNQSFRVRLVCSLGIWAGENPIAITITQPDPEKTITYTAQPVRITQDSLMYHTFGDGWVCYFMDDRGEELTWHLEGGEFSCQDLCLSLVPEDGQEINAARLQVQIISDNEE